MIDKPRLNVEEMITAAYLYVVRGVSQQDISIALMANNVGRVNEAIKAIVAAADEMAGKA